MSSIHSNWGDWFVREEVEAADPRSLSIWYLGCNGFVLRSPEATVYLDPYFGDGYAADGVDPRVVRMLPVPLDPADATRCDAVLVTHEHRDHFHPPSYGPLVGEGATLHAPASCFGPERHYRGDVRATDGERRVVSPGDAFEVADLTVHVRGGDDPDSAGEVTYVIEHESGTFFNSGDSRVCEAFHEVGDEFDVDVGSLTYGSRGRVGFPAAGEVRRTDWYMDENGVVEAANALELDRLVPCHFDMWKGVGADPKVLHEHATSHEYPRVVEVAEIGDRFDVDRPGIRRLRAVGGNAASDAARGE